jgi:hypothetical protein
MNHFTDRMPWFWPVVSQESSQLQQKGEFHIGSYNLYRHYWRRKTTNGAAEGENLHWELHPTATIGEERRRRRIKNDERMKLKLKRMITLFHTTLV